MSGDIRVLFEFLVSEWGAFVISLAIAGVGVWRLLRFSRAVAQCRNEVERATSSLMSLEPGRIYDEFENISSDLRALHAIGPIWERYTSALIWDHEEKRVWSTVDPSLLWDGELLLESYVNLRCHRGVPNLLTGLGLLGTFIGLVIGIYLAKDGLASGDPITMQEGLGQLLGGAYAAFFTSIVGIAMSFVVSWQDKRQTRALKREVDRFCQLLSERIPSRSNVHFLNDIVREAREQTAQLKSFSHELAISLGEVMSHRLTEVLGSTLLKLVESVEALRQEQRSTNQSAIEQMIAQFQTSLSGAAGREFQAMSETLRELTGAAESIRNMLVETQAGVRGELEAGLTALREGMREFASDLRRNEFEVAEARRRELEELQAMMSAALQQMQAEVDAVVETFRSAGEKLHGSVSRASEQLVEKVLASGDDLVKSATQARESFEKAGESLQGTVENLRRCVAELADVVDTARRNEAESTHAWTGLIGQMRQTLHAVANIYGDIRSLAAELQSSNDALRQLGLQMRSTVQQLGATSSIIQEVGRNIEQQTSTLTRVWEEQRGRFERLDKELAEAVEQIHVAYEKLSENQKAFLSSMETQLSKIASILAGAVEEMHEVVEGLDQRWTAS